MTPEEETKIGVAMAVLQEQHAIATNALIDARTKLKLLQDKLNEQAVADVANELKP